MRSASRAPRTPAVRPLHHTFKALDVETFEHALQQGRSGAHVKH